MVLAEGTAQAKVGKLGVRGGASGNWSALERLEQGASEGKNSEGGGSAWRLLAHAPLPLRAWNARGHWTDGATLEFWTPAFCSNGL